MSEPAFPVRSPYRMGRRFLLGSLLVILFSAIGTASFLLLQVHQAVEVFQEEAKSIPGIQNELDAVDPGGPQTILVLGSDRRYQDRKSPGYRGLSDTVILVRLDPEREATALLSFPRDLVLNLPGYGMKRLNQAYALGGPRLTLRALQQLTSLEINHVVNVGFGGFQRAVNRLDCVYAEVDRRYFNDNSGPGENYAVIDLQPGYQRLCGADALSFVRFRHQDSDFVRAARQHEFLRQAKAQVGLERLFQDRNQLLQLFGRYTETDIADDNDAAIIRLLKLAYLASRKPLQQIDFPGQVGADGGVYVDQADLLAVIQQFTEARATAPGKTAAPRRLRRPRQARNGLINDRAGALAYFRDLRRWEDRLPVMLPSLRLARGGYVGTRARYYQITDPRRGTSFPAYRATLSENSANGQYYGFQASAWKDPPILKNPTDTVVLNGRTVQRYFDGKRLRMLAWRTPRAVYWLSNTLNLTLSKAQMTGIMASLQPLPED